MPNLQTALLSLPVALLAYFLKGVVPEWDLKDIYLGMMQFMVIQLTGLLLIIFFPEIALWRLMMIYGPLRPQVQNKGASYMTTVQIDGSSGGAAPRAAFTS